MAVAGQSDQRSAIGSRLSAKAVDRLNDDRLIG
jgi:hypothetical protein